MSYPTEQQSEYVLNSAILSNSERNTGFDIEIKNIITSFQIFEHIEKPYLTAQFIVIDTSNLIQDYDFQGGEKLTIDIIQSEEQNDGISITKEFLIDKIEETSRTDETTDSVIFHCVEYHTFKSSLQNISRSYTGPISSIISKIFSEYLQRDVLNDFIDEYKNLDPVDSLAENYSQARIFCLWSAILGHELTHTAGLGHNKNYRDPSDPPYVISDQLKTVCMDKLYSGLLF